MRLLVWPTAGAGVAVLACTENSDAFRWGYELFMDRLWVAYRTLSSEWPGVFTMLDIVIPVAFTAWFLFHQDAFDRVLPRLRGRVLGGWYARLRRYPRAVKLPAKALLGVLTLFALVYLKELILWRVGAWGAIGVLALVLGGEARRLARRSRRLTARIVAFLGLPGAFGILYIEQIAEWKYGTVGFLLVVLITYGACSPVFSPWQPPSRASHRLVAAATWVAGPRRPHLSSEWSAVLAAADDPETGVPPRARHRLARGFLYAAIRMRLADMNGPLWVPVDWVLRVERRTNTVIAAVVGAQAVYIVGDGGLPALVTDVWEPCGILGGALYVLSRWLRRVRGIELAAARSDDRHDE